MKKNANVEISKDSDGRRNMRKQLNAERVLKIRRERYLSTYFKELCQEKSTE